MIVSSRMKKKRPVLLCLLMAVPVVLYFAFFFKMAVNIPFGDDYPVMGSVLDLTNPNVPDKSSVLFAQFNEHRIATLRIVLVFFHYLGLPLDFKIIALLGNLFILGIVFALFKASAAKTGVSFWPLSFVPTFYLIFQPQHHQLTTWAMCAFTNILVILFAFAAFYLLVHSRGSLAFPAAVLCAVLAVYTNGNGVFVPFIGVFILVMNKEFKRLAVWIPAGLVSLGFFFYGYAAKSDTPSLLHMLKDHGVDLIKYFFSVSGVFADFGFFRPILTITVGMAMILGFLGLLKKGLHRRDPFFFSALVFVFLSLISLALSRTAYGLEQSFTSRYKFTSILMLVLLYLACVGQAKNKRPGIIVPILAFSLFFSTASFIRNYHQADVFRTVFIGDLFKWNAGRGRLAYADPRTAEIFLRDGVRRGFYRPPYDLERLKYPFGDILPADGAGQVNPVEILISGWALDDGGAPTVLAYRGPAVASGGKPRTGRLGLEYLGRAKFREGTISNLARQYFGFPGLNRTIWEYRFRPGKVPLGKKPEVLYFYAVDGFGRETLLGIKSF